MQSCDKIEQGIGAASWSDGQFSGGVAGWTAEPKVCTIYVAKFSFIAGFCMCVFALRDGILTLNAGDISGRLHFQGLLEEGR